MQQNAIVVVICKDLRVIKMLNVYYTPRLYLGVYIIEYVFELFVIS